MNMKGITAKYWGIAAITLGIVYTAPAGADTLKYTALLGEKIVNVSMEGSGAEGQITPEDTRKALNHMKIKIYREYKAASLEEQEKMKKDIRLYRATMNDVAKTLEKVYENINASNDMETRATVERGFVTAAIISSKPDTETTQH